MLQIQNNYQKIIESKVIREQSSKNIEYINQAIEAFKNELSDFSVSKGTIRFSYDKELQASLIKRIAKWCYGEYGK